MAGCVTESLSHWLLNFTCKRLMGHTLLIRRIILLFENFWIIKKKSNKLWKRKEHQVYKCLIHYLHWATFDVVESSLIPRALSPNPPQTNPRPRLSAQVTARAGHISGAKRPLEIIFVHLSFTWTYVYLFILWTLEQLGCKALLSLPEQSWSHIFSFHSFLY